MIYQSNPRVSSVLAPTQGDVVGLHGLALFRGGRAKKMHEPLGRGRVGKQCPSGIQPIQRQHLRQQADFDPAELAQHIVGERLVQAGEFAPTVGARGVGITGCASSR